MKALFTLFLVALSAGPGLAQESETLPCQAETRERITRLEANELIRDVHTETILKRLDKMERQLSDMEAPQLPNAFSKTFSEQLDEIGKDAKISDIEKRLSRIERELTYLR